MLTQYVCVSKPCRARIEMEIPDARAGGARPTCVCGAEMKKVYGAPDLVKMTQTEAARRFGNFATAAKSKRESAD